MLAPVTHGPRALLHPALVGYACRHTFDFIFSYDVRYFCLVLVALLVLGLLNGLVFLPVLLVIVSPQAQVTAQDSADSLPPATPQPSPCKMTI